MDKILTLLDLNKQASQSPNIKSFEFFLLNQTNTLVKYKQAVFWTKTDFGVELNDVSGNTSIDRDGPYAQWLKSFIKKTILNSPAEENQSGLVFVSYDMLDDNQKTEWKEYAGAHGACAVFQTEQDGVLGGIWFERDEEFTDKDKALLEELCLLYTQTYALLRLRKNAALRSPWKKIKTHQKIVTACFLLACFSPVRLTVTAPAEIVAQNPTVITVPYDGVMDGFNVKPGQKVTEQQLLFSMDTTDLDGKIETTGQALKTATKNLSRIRKESLSAPEKKTEIAKLISEISAREIEYNHAQNLMKKSKVNAPISGISIFSDANDFEGQPLRTGEKIMIIADPDKVELLIKVPVDNMLPISQESPVDFFLNVSPLNGYKAEILNMGYQAGIDPDGLLTYKIRARIPETKDLRIGWKGTSKIKGDWTILAYSVLRRPLITLRHITGL